MINSCVDICNFTDRTPSCLADTVLITRYRLAIHISRVQGLRHPPETVTPSRLFAAFQIDITSTPSLTARNSTKSPFSRRRSRVMGVCGFPTALFDKQLATSDWLDKPRTVQTVADAGPHAGPTNATLR